MDKKAKNNTTIRIAFLVAIFYTVSFSDDSLFDDVYVDSTLHIRNGVVVNNGTAKLKGADTVTSTNYVYVLKESDTSIAIIPVDSIGGGGSVDSVRAAYISDTVKNIPSHGHGIDSVYNLQDSLNAKISGSLSTNRLVKATSSNTVGSASITQYAYYDPVYIWAETENIGGGKYTLGLNETGTEGEGVGPGIVFSSISAVAGIFGVKANGTAGDYSGLFGIQTKQNSLGRLVTRWLVDSLGRMSNDTLVHDSSFHAGSGMFTGGLRAEGSTLLMGCDTVVSSSYLYTLNSTDTSVSLISIDTVLKDVVDDLNSKQDTLYRESGVNNGIVYMNDDWGAYNLYAANWMTYDNAFGDVDYSGNMFNLEYGTNKGILSFSSNVNTRVWGLQNDSGKVYVKYTDTAGAGYPNPWTVDTTLMVIKKDSLVLHGSLKVKGDTTVTAACSLYDGATLRATGTLIYNKLGRVVTVQFPALSGTLTNGNDVYINHLDVDFKDPYNSVVYCGTSVSNNGSVVAGGFVQDTDGSKTALHPNGISTSWTTGTGGIPLGGVFTYISQN